MRGLNVLSATVYNTFNVVSYLKYLMDELKPRLDLGLVIDFDTF